MSPSEEFRRLYAGFHAPISLLDCGKKCSPYNEKGVPFCCDTHHVIPTAYLAEWDYLENHTNLWHRWSASDPETNAHLQAQKPSGQVLIECLGHELCQREYRAITCRAFPFFPYIDQEGRFLGLSYYWEYEDRCWVISHLQVVTPEYREEFIRTFEAIFQVYPEEYQAFLNFSFMMRNVFTRRRRRIVLLHRNGYDYKITPRTGKLRRVPLDRMLKFGPYRIAARLPFPGENNDG